MNQGSNINNLINEKIINKINSEIEKGFTDLKDLKKRLPEKITYPLIRIALRNIKFTSGLYFSRYQYNA